MKRAAVYRMLYGEDFIKESIESIIYAVDEVYIFWTNQVWGNCKKVNYLGEEIEFPRKFDDAVEKIKEIDSPKIRLIEDYFPTPHGQYTYLVNNFVQADVVVLIEPDQVIDYPNAAFTEFQAAEVPCAAMRQIEYWKNAEYRIPERQRPGPIFWRPPLPPTKPNGLPSFFEPKWLGAIAKNYGFCVSDKTMYWKHLTALAFSPVIGDSLPREDWYEEIWLKWTPEMKNLEISKNHPGAIPYAYKIG